VNCVMLISLLHSPIRDSSSVAVFMLKGCEIQNKGRDSVVYLQALSRNLIVEPEVFRIS
ncbi:hypothetical protein L873DRAFT_1805898, partial [Choiromyces venosus 120613-1]